MMDKEMKEEKDWMESEAEIVKIGNYYYLNLDGGHRLGKKFRTLNEAKCFLKINGVKKARYFHGGEFKRVLIC